MNWLKKLFGIKEKKKEKSVIHAHISTGGNGRSYGRSSYYNNPNDPLNPASPLYMPIMNNIYSNDPSTGNSHNDDNGNHSPSNDHGSSNHDHSSHDHGSSHSHDTSSYSSPSDTTSFDSGSSFDSGGGSFDSGSW